MSNAKTYKPVSAAALKNSIVPVSATVFLLQLVGESDINELADEIKKVAKTCNADGAVNVSFLVSYANLHALHSDGFFGAGFQQNMTENLAIEVRYIFADDEGAYHIVTPCQLIYVGKYLRKYNNSVAAKTYKIELAWEQLMCLDRAIENRAASMYEGKIRGGMNGRYFDGQLEISETILVMIQSSIDTANNWNYAACGEEK